MGHPRGEAVSVPCVGAGPSVLDHLLDDVTGQVWRLVLQRACAGARAGNLQAISRAYDIPPAALRRV